MGAWLLIAVIGLSGFFLCVANTNDKRTRR